VRLYEPLLTAYVRRRGPGEEDTREIVQDVFVRLVKTLPDFRLDRQKGRFRSWLWQICQSALVDWARRRRRRARAEDGWLNRLSEASWPNESDSDDLWVGMHRRRVLTFALETVRTRSRRKTWACFERHLLQRRPSAAVAGELGVTVNAVDVNSSRVLDRVREFCDKYLEGLTDDVDVLSAGP
jgi:RNA polymerase sigma-70 factor (ECF subfamily)